MADPIWSVLQQALASGSRSTVLKPLGWLVALTLAGAISAFSLNPTIWFSNVLGVMCVLSIILYIVAYIYFAITDKDALRSEKYSIQKLAIKNGFIGDDQTGYIPLKQSAYQHQDLIGSEVSKSKEEG
ncbi:hypothetical protein [Pseudomonas rustica]|uniref:hypothetical protein n=1 Tax=Pseudomonas rustica TaxID=2827099 RepID=UPI001BB08DFF|nr:hypothetical protein [Pseudomonas rustica]MBS4090522.1 hypothetical protein [Pseudomonas rustica]